MDLRQKIKEENKGNNSHNDVAVIYSVKMEKYKRKGVDILKMSPEKSEKQRVKYEVVSARQEAASLSAGTEVKIWGTSPSFLIV